MTLTFSSINCDKILKTHFYLSSDIFQVRQQIYHTDKVIVVKNVFYVFYFLIKNMFFNVFYSVYVFLFLKTFIIY